MPADNVDAVYQGVPGAFSEQAGRALLGAEARLQPCRSFEEALRLLAAGRVPAAIVPLRNSLAGPVPGVASLIRRHRVRVMAEHVHPIALAVIGVPGAALPDLRRVRSHPMALAQCRRWIRERPALAIRAAFDTAGAVAQVVARGDAAEAAIAGPHVAALYGGAVLAAGVHDQDDNATTFALLRV